MIIEIGHFCVILAFVLCIVQAIFKHLSLRCYAIIFTLLLSGEGALIWGFIIADFSIANIAQNTNPIIPPLYRIFDSWNNNINGTYLLSLLALSASLWRVKTLIGVNLMRGSGVVMAALIAIMLSQYNPFLRLSLPAIEGDNRQAIMTAPIMPLIIISAFFFIRIYLNKRDII